MSDRGVLNLPPSLSAVRVAGVPDTAYYISDFISESEEAHILDKITTRPASAWTQLSHRRLQVYPSLLSTRNEMSTGQLPSWLENPVISRLTSIPLSSAATEPSKQHLFSASPHRRPNHVLVNEYPPGVGIFPHEDGPAYYPIVATVSMGSHTVLDIYDKDPRTGIKASKAKWRILQERRSLLVSTGELYSGTLHGIGEVKSDEGLDEETMVNWSLLREESRNECERQGGSLKRGLRVSATLRDVLKVRDWGRLVPGLGKRK